MKPDVRVTVQNASTGGTVPAPPDIRAWIRHTLAEADPGALTKAEVTVRVVDEDESRALNLRFRGKDDPTNVLAFPADADAFPAVPGEAARRALGDIVICAAVADREAAEQGKAAAGHWYHLLVHGMLHLLGHDHRTDRDAAVMEQLETRILAARGVADPYAQGSGRGGL